MFPYQINRVCSFQDSGQPAFLTRHSVCVARVCRIWFLTVFLRLPRYPLDVLTLLLNIYEYCIYVLTPYLDNGATVYAIVSIETNIGIVCGCLPGCKSLISRFLPKLFGCTNASTHHSTRNGRSLPPNIQSFPFQELHGVLLKRRGFQWSTGEMTNRTSSARNTYMTLLLRRDDCDRRAMRML